MDEVDEDKSIMTPVLPSPISNMTG